MLNQMAGTAFCHGGSRLQHTSSRSDWSDGKEEAFCGLTNHAQKRPKDSTGEGTQEAFVAVQSNTKQKHRTRVEWVEEKRNKKAIKKAKAEAKQFVRSGSLKKMQVWFSPVWRVNSTQCKKLSTHTIQNTHQMSRLGVATRD
jgi:hypothetical protein